MNTTDPLVNFKSTLQIKLSILLCLSRRRTKAFPARKDRNVLFVCTFIIWKKLICLAWVPILDEEITSKNHCVNDFFSFDTYVRSNGQCIFPLKFVCVVIHVLIYSFSYIKLFHNYPMLCKKWQSIIFVWSITTKRKHFKSLILSVHRLFSNPNPKIS